VQYYITPMYNVLRSLIVIGLGEQALDPLDTFISNDKMLDHTMTDSHQVDLEN
jgi:hypothetical protein